MTIGELMKALRALREDAEVYFDFPGDQRPTELMSYRGYYNRPAIGYGPEEKLAHRLADELEADLMEEHEGYKGGFNRYAPNDTPYVANYGRTSSVVVTGLLDEGWRGVILTEYRP